jgi:hypothetical protein
MLAQPTFKRLTDLGMPALHRRWRLVQLTTTLASALAVLPLTARAAEPEANQSVDGGSPGVSPEQATQETPSKGAEVSKEGDVPRRQVPDYEGRGPEPTTAGDVLIWVPRVILLPPYLVMQYLIRVPVGAGATYAELHDWPTWIFNFFAFGPDHQGGIYPTFFVDFNMRASIGLHFFWNNTFTRGNKVTADAAWGGSQWIAVGVGDSYAFSRTESLSFQARWNRRPDTLFYGIGSQVQDTLPSRVGSDVVDGTVTYNKKLGRLELETKAVIRRTVFRNYTCCGDPSLQQRVEAGQLPAPPGYQENTTAASLGLKGVLDTRPDPPLPQTGVRVALGLNPTVDVGRGFDRSWMGYGAAVEGFLDVTGKARVISLGVTALFVDHLGSEPVPFTDLVSLGGTEPFAGFLPYRLRDRSALAAQLGWHWPVFPYLDGVAAVSFGNVFDSHLDNFRFELLRLGAELGVRTTALGSGSFEFVVGIGTETFRDGLRLSSFRLAFGVTYGL